MQAVRHEEHASFQGVPETETEDEEETVLRWLYLRATERKSER